MSAKHWHLISYDVRHPKRLRKVAQKLESYGNRVQYSVFRCRLDRQTLEKLHWELNQILEDEDDLLVIPLVPVVPEGFQYIPQETRVHGPNPTNISRDLNQSRT